MAFRKGSAQAEQASQFASFEKTQFFKIEPKEGGPPPQKVLRFITEAFTGKIVDGRLVQVPDDDEEAMGGWITVDTHQNIPTKARPADYKGENWPTAMPAVCRYDKAFAADPETGTPAVYSDCFIHDVLMPQNSKLKKPSGRQWAWAVEREPVIGDGSEALGGPARQGQVLGYRDGVRTVKRKKEGSEEMEEIEEKAIVIVNQGYKNFFGALTGFASIYGTALDRDYVVQRKGSGTATDYNLIPLPPITLSDGRAFDLRDDALLKEKYGKTHEEFDKSLQEIVTERSSDDYYGMWFNPAWTRKGATEGEGGAEAPSSAEPNEDEMAALRDRITGYQPGAEGAPAQTPEQAAAAQQPAQPDAAAAAAAPAGGMRAFD